ncbi:hypothetical protein SUGI_0114580 [Cryptomeria japonica]|nr:hypothetical protein SUGI_0114580 [Cryptomeria japonica]
MDVHCRLVRKYKAIPKWWFFMILALTLTVTITFCDSFKDQRQLRWWGVLLSCGLAIFFALPNGIIKATIDKLSKSCILKKIMVIMLQILA